MSCKLLYIAETKLLFCEVPVAHVSYTLCDVGVISALCWDPSSLYLVSAGGDDRHIRVWHNTPGMQQLLLDLEARLPKATSEPLKRRILEQMNETR